jgi:hypothetical protein
VFAGVGFEFGPGHAHTVACFFEAQFRIPQFQIFVDIVDEGEQRFLHG